MNINDQNMKNIIINRLCLTDWKAKNLDVKFNAGVTNISAKNEVGKSSLQQAWNWLLTSYTTANSVRNANLFDNKKPLSPDTPIASVKAWVTIDGTDYTLERTAQAKFKRSRGSKEWVKDSSDAYTIKVDDCELTATQFDEWIEYKICPISILPFVLDGAFFTTLAIQDKMKARAVIEQVVGAVDISELKGDYERIKDKLSKYTPEQIKDQIFSEMRPVKKRMDAIPSVIKSKESTIETIESKYDLHEISEKLDALIEEAAEYAREDTIYEIIATSKRLGMSEYAQIEKAQIDLLKGELKTLACQLAELEGDKATVEALMEERAAIIGDRINKLMDDCKITMFATQKNGDRVPDCTVTDAQGVLFATLSNSARLRANLAIQKMFREQMGVNMMTWIDEASVFDSEHKPRPDGQVCYLFAGDSPTLIVE